MSRRRGRVQVPVESESEVETEVEQGDDEGAAGESDAGEIDPSDPVLAGVRLSMDNLKQLAKDIIPTCDTDEKREHIINRLKTCMKNLIRTEMNHVEGLKTVSRVSAELPEHDSSDDQAILRACDHLEKVTLQKINEYKASLTDAILMRHSNYKSLLLEIQSALGSESHDDANSSIMDIDGPDRSRDVANRSVADLENDDGAGSEFIPTTDPITKQPLTDPVRNRICKHIYGKASILELIKSNPNVRCTTAGCSNRNFVKASDLIVDKKLAAKVRKKVAEARKNKLQTTEAAASASTEDEDDDD